MSYFRAIPAASHVLGTVARNIGPAIRMSWPWLAIYATVQAVGLLLFPDLEKMFAGDRAAFTDAAPGTGIMFLTLLVLSTLAFSSLAVNWHRFMLLGEEAEGGERLRLDATVFRYMGNAMLIGLVVSIFSLLAIVPVMSVALDASTIAGAVLFMVIYFMMFIGHLVLYSRLFLKLPAIALERDDYGVANAWADSSGNNLRIAGFIVLLSIILLIALVVLGVPLAFLMIAQDEPSTTMSVLGWTFQLVLNWLGWIVGINALTTLYGIFAEGREV